MKKYRSLLPIDEEGYYGRFGGAYIPEILHDNVKNLATHFTATLTTMISKKNSTH